MMQHPRIIIFAIVCAFLLSSFVCNAKKDEKKIAKEKNPHKSIPSSPKGSKLESKAVIESGCIPKKAVKELKPEFINKVAAWYVPVASKYFYYRWGEALINRSMGASELPNLCMKWLFLGPTTPKGKYNVLIGKSNGFYGSNGGYHHAVTQLCQDTGYNTHSCEAVKGSPDFHKGADSVATIVATDNRRWFMMARCVQKKYKDWAVFTTDRKSLDTALYKKIIAEAKNQGFDTKFVENAKYEKCPKKI